MYLAEHAIIPPKEFYHDPSLRTNDYIYDDTFDCCEPIKLNIHMTVAMFLAYNGLIPPDCWYHNPHLMSDYNCGIRFIKDSYPMI